MSRIVIVLPRGRRFGPEGATSIDLCVRDFVSFSRFRQSTTILGEAIDRPFPDLDFRSVARPDADAQWLFAQRLAEAAASLQPDLVVVHQHMPSAVRIAKRLKGIPVLLHRHNKPKARSNAFGRWRDRTDYGLFARTIWVSEFCRSGFAGIYPELASRAAVIHNGIDFAAWTPALQRQREILFVGRLDPEKGCLESALAAAQVLPEASGWRVRFALSKRGVDPNYLAAVQAALAPLGERARIDFDLQHEAVLEAFSSAAIALAPSIFQEPFGRTAIEAFAGGAALITSMRGGLAEIAAGYAEEAIPPTSDTIAAALRRLINDPEHLRKLAHNGRLHGERHFDIRGVTSRLDDLYDAVLSERGRPPQTDR